MKRIESGPVQFGEDWPGVFLRGDEAFLLAHAIGRVLEDNPQSAESSLAHIRELCLKSNQSSPAPKLKLKPIGECLCATTKQ